jgi:Flp pilus assembly pilin Flp
MSATSISFGLLIALVAILLLYRMGKLKPQLAGFRRAAKCLADNFRTLPLGRSQL